MNSRKICTVNYYPHEYPGFSGTRKAWACETEFINEITGAVLWKVYYAANRKKVLSIAQAQATKFHNSMIRIYG